MKACALQRNGRWNNSGAGDPQRIRRILGFQFNQMPFALQRTQPKPKAPDATQVLFIIALDAFIGSKARLDDLVK